MAQHRPVSIQLPLLSCQHELLVAAAPLRLQLAPAQASTRRELGSFGAGPHAQHSLAAKRSARCSGLQARRAQEDKPPRQRCAVPLPAGSLEPGAGCCEGQPAAADAQAAHAGLRAWGAFSSFSALPLLRTLSARVVLLGFRVAQLHHGVCQARRVQRSLLLVRDKQFDKQLDKQFDKQRTQHRRNPGCAPKSAGSKPWGMANSSTSS